MGVAAGVSFGLITVGVLTVLTTDPDVSGMADLLRVDSKASAVLMFDQHLAGGGWMVLPFFHFGMTTGFNLLQLTQAYMTTIHNWTIITHSFH